jgi:hypothetical protein
MLGFFLFSEAASAYGPLAHTIVAFRARDTTLAKLHEFFPETNFSDPQKSRLLAASMAGALLQDVGYVDPKLRSLSDILHYQGTGFFEERFITTSVLRQSKPQVVAFALGTLLHYAGDREGHKWATNRASAHLLHVETQVGAELAYEDNPDCHTCIEKVFDSLSLATLSPAERDEFISDLDGLAGLVNDDREFLAFVIAPALTIALEDAYVLTDSSIKALTTRGETEPAYVALVPAYKTMLDHISAALGAAKTSYGVDFPYDKLRFFPKLLEKALQNRGHCYPEADVPAFVKQFHVLSDSINKSVALYADYAQNAHRPPLLPPSLSPSLWKAGETLPNVNIDTNVISAAGEYFLADHALSSLEDLWTGQRTPQSDIPSFVKTFVRLGEDRRNKYFVRASLEDEQLLERQIRDLDKWERRSSSIAEPTVQWQLNLPDALPKVYALSSGRCSHPGFARLTLGSSIFELGSTFVCSAKQTNVLQMWIAVLAWNRSEANPVGVKHKAEFAEWHNLYLSRSYAYARKGPGWLKEIPACVHSNQPSGQSGSDQVTSRHLSECSGRFDARQGRNSKEMDCRRAETKCATGG